MPAERLASAPVHIRQFDVVGLDSPAASNFVCHVALSAEHRPDHVPASRLPLSHMHPPLEVGRDHGPITTAGTVPLTPDEVQAVAVFIAERESEYIAAGRREVMNQYVVRPHQAPVTGVDGTLICHRYSCVGFVLAAYDSAGIPLIDTEETRLPPVELAAIITAYPALQRELSIPRLRQRVGLDGDGPWPVVLAGYVLNALARSEPEIRAAPYAPRAGHECFPAGVAR